MRETEPIEPMWEAPDGVAGPRAWGAATRLSSRLLRRAMPHVYRWAAGQRPGVIVAWGATEYRVARAGLLRRRREGPGWEDNPRSNYNEAVSRRQERDSSRAVDEARKEAETARAQASRLEEAQGKTEAKLKKARADARKARADAKAARAEVAELQAASDDASAGGALDFSAESLQAEVRSAMGLNPAGDEVEVSRDPEVVRQQLDTMRAILQALDDVADFDLVEAVDDELYKLHKAVEYKLKNHKASEAKAKLDGLFK